jgi:pyridoxal phosphate enzyme (YggS family)
MAIHTEQYRLLLQELGPDVTLVAVSKTKPAEDILALYELGQRDFGENYVQELTEKAPSLPKDIRWHFIGHLQSNKVKYIVPFVHLIQGVDSLKLLKEIDKQSAKAGRVTDCLLQVHIATEETKFGLDGQELSALLGSDEFQGLKNIRTRGLMGMASFSDDQALLKKEFTVIRELYQRYGNGWNTLSMGMSSDYRLAVQEGSNMVRVGSLLFGARTPVS